MSNFIKKIFEKIKDFIMRKKNNENLLLEAANINSDEKKEDKNENNLIGKIKAENKKNQTVKDIIEIIEEKPELLENLSVEKLTVIDNYYKEEINKAKVINMELKSKLNRSEELIEKNDLKIKDLKTKKVS